MRSKSLAPSLFRELESLFWYPSLFERTFEILNKSFGFGASFDKAVDGSDLVLNFQLDGMDDKDVSVTLKDGSLIVEGQKSEDNTQTYFKVIQSVPNNIKVEDIDAMLKGKDLIVRIKDMYKPKELSDVKKIEVKT